ncbi:hypothetical protein PTUN_a0469 [Pseudoalteromonas tunicata]|nr:hypothetical protein PTUN_a0469 [Pseudoalteromonas tunicata]
MILLTIFINDASVFATLLNIENPSNLRRLQLMGLLLIMGCIIYGFALINFKNQDNKRLVLYFFMAGLFILIPFILATSPYSILTLFE